MSKYKVTFSKNHDKMTLECDEKIINNNMNTEKFCEWLTYSGVKFEFIGENEEFEFYESIDNCIVEKF